MQVSSTKRPSRVPPAAELAKQLAGFFRYVTTTCDGEFLEEVSGLDLSLGQVKVLSLLAMRSDEPSVKALADELGISLPAASRAIDPLVQRKLVARTEDSDDRRVKRIGLTTRGRTLVERIIALRVASLEGVIDQLSEPQRRKLAAALDALRDQPEIARFYPGAQS